jgi:hypothetical protein
MLDICVAGFQCQSWIDILLVREVSSPLLSSPLLSDPKASPDSEDDAWAKLNLSL